MVSVSNLLFQDLTLESGWYRSCPLKLRSQQIQKLDILPPDERENVGKMLLLKFCFCFFGGSWCAILHGTFGLSSVMLRLYMGVESRIGEIFFATTANKISAFDVFTRSSARLSSFQLLLVLMLLVESVIFLFKWDDLLFCVLRWIHL